VTWQGKNAMAYEQDSAGGGEKRQRGRIMPIGWCGTALCGGSGSSTCRHALLLGHVAEHMSSDSAVEILTTYLPYLKPGGRLVLITPQEAGYRSDSTHVRFVGFEAAEDLAQAAGLRTERRYSFPFPRAVGKMFRFNEFVTIARHPGP
jgi:hypothetical protein